MNYKNENENEKELRIIGQGTYGCVFSPNISCSTPYTPKSTKFLSKIQKINATSTNEIEIGEIVKTIKNFSAHFAPIINSCPVKLGKMNREEFTSCKMIVNEKKKQTIKSANLVSNKMLNVGSKTFGDKLYELSVTENKGKYIKKLCESHIYLLDSIIKLYNVGVIHMDIKDNNIMYDDTPIFIDFGLSSNINHIKDLSKRFGIAVPFYAPWCIEILMLSFISKHVINKKINVDTGLEKVDDFKQYFRQYVQKNKILHSNLFTQEERSIYIEKHMGWIDTFKGKTWKTLWMQLASAYKSWDAYGLSMMYLNEMSHSSVIYINEDGFLKQYVGTLKSHLTEIPSERKNAEELITILTNIFKNVNKAKYKSIIQKIDAIYKNAANRQQMKKVREDSALATLVVDKQLYRKYNYRAP